MKFIQTIQDESNSEGKVENSKVSGKQKYFLQLRTNDQLLH